MSRGWLIGLGGAVVVLMAMLAAFLLSARGVLDDITAARGELAAARIAIPDGNQGTAPGLIASAADHAASAADATSGPLWSIAGALPLIGAAPRTVATIASSADVAVQALVPAAGSLIALDGAGIVGGRGRVDLPTIEAALPEVAQANDGIGAAFEALAEAPSAASGDMVPPSVEGARAQMAAELDSLNAKIETLMEFGSFVPELLGADGPKRYFFAITNPNEARGMGGFLGTYAIVTADQGKLTVDEVGSNSDLPTLARLPRAALGADFISRYGQEATLNSGMNISPHFPAAGRLWVDAWEQKTGERLDGALSADVVALGDLIAATGKTVALPDGGTLTGAQLTDFALTGIYEKFPEAEESPARKEYQEQVAAAALEVATGTGGEGLARAIAAGVGERRILAWVRDRPLQREVERTALGGSLAVRDGPNVTAVVINSSASKLDTYLEREVRYGVGRCVDARSKVRSTVTMTLTNDVPEGEQLPPYVIAQADVGPRGPINSTLAQIHLPNGAQVLVVQVDGKPAFYSPFQEQGRPALVLDVNLPPRRARTIEVVFSEPQSGAGGSVAVQPLARPQTTTVVDRPC